MQRTPVEQYRSTTQTIREIGSELSVTAILEGGVQRAGDRVRINVQLINTANDDHLWAESYEAYAVWASLGLVNRNLLRYSIADDAFRRTIDLDDKNSSAWHWYARSLWQQRRFADGLAASQAAYTLEPMSYAFNRRLASFYGQMGEFAQQRQHLRRSDQVAQSQSRTSSVPIIFSYYWEGEISRAIEDARAFLVTTPEDLGAIDAMVLSMLDLNDIQQVEVWAAHGNAISNQFRVGFRVFLAQNDYRSAISDLEETLDIQRPIRSLWVLYELFKTHLYAGDEAIARDYLNEFVDAQQGRIEVRPYAADNRTAVMVAAYWIRHGEYALSEPSRGRELAEEVRTTMTALKDVGWLHPLMFVSLAAAEVLLGDHDAAIANLHEAIDSGFRNQGFSLFDLPFHELRDDPRFAEVIARIDQYREDERIRWHVHFRA
jgi:tetratricopeptide (TPR) repeat protein